MGLQSRRVNYFVTVFLCFDEKAASAAVWPAAEPPTKTRTPARPARNKRLIDQPRLGNSALADLDDMRPASPH